MEIDITDFVHNAEPAEFSASVAELGQCASRITWRNAVKEAAETPLLTTEAQLDALRDDMKGTGAWERAEIDAWDAEKCNAIFIQLISGDLREMPTDDDGEIDWAEAEQQSEAGRIKGCIYRGDIEGTEGYGRIFYYLGD